MSLLLACNLLFDTDQDNLFSVDEIPHDTVWISARVYKSVNKELEDYEVWSYEWDPQSNKEEIHFVRTFQDLEEAKSLAIQIARGGN